MKINPVSRKVLTRPVVTLAALALLLLPLQLPLPAVAASTSAPAAPPQQVDIGLNGFFSANKAQRGRTIQAAVVLDIPDGFHVNSTKPLSKYLVPTTVKVEAPGAIRIGPVSYPRAAMHRLKSSSEQLAVYDGRAVMRFNVTIPADFSEGMTELRVRVRYQSCNDEVCFPPVTRSLTLPLGVVGANDSVQRTNSQYFGGGGGRRRR